MQSKILTKALSVVLALAMVVGLFSGSFVSKSNAATTGNKKNVSYTKVENLGNGRLFADKQKVKEFEETYVKDGMIRVSIVLSEKSALQKGFSTSIAGNADVAAYRAELRAQQNALADRISRTVLGGEKLDVVWNITLAGNMISANVPYDKLDAISMVRGVEKVVVEALYEPEKGETVVLKPTMAGASTMVGSSYVWEEGYTGLGGRIAIVDTGLDTNHELFDPEALEYAIEKSGKNVALLTADEIDEVLEYLNIYYKIGDPDLTAEDLYVNTKVPFGANYVDSDLDVTHDNDGQGDHGSHVSGIAAGNRYVTDDEGGFVKSLDKVQTQGEAPDAQLLVMKVFGKGGGAYDSDYLVAIEDAFVLGCDSVNLSLGSAMAGMATSPTYQAIIDSFAYSDTVVSISAGNA
ncbi:MAG: S8 family serine peptidase, partial [Clostridia bacterium]|nr:S8 family serine peptidase [Clostridia bacterium]